MITNKDIFNPPVRLTRCGHNFCHQCISEIARVGQEWNCPECRTVIRSPADQLYRNRIVERIVENRQNNGQNNVGNRNENSRPTTPANNGQDIAPNLNENQNQNDIPENVALCREHDQEFTVCKYGMVTVLFTVECLDSRKLTG